MLTKCHKSKVKPYIFFLYITIRPIVYFSAAHAAAGFLLTESWLHV